MNTQPTDPNSSQIAIEQRMRTVRTLWLVMLLSVGLYFMYTRFIAERPENLQPNSQFSLALLVAGISTSVISFLVKKVLINRSIQQRQMLQVQQAYVVGMAIAEVAALLGILDFLVTSDPYYYVLIAIAGCAQLLHFPRRDHFEQAAANPPINL